MNISPLSPHAHDGGVLVRGARTEESPPPVRLRLVGAALGVPLVPPDTSPLLRPEVAPMEFNTAPLPLVLLPRVLLMLGQ